MRIPSGIDEVVRQFLDEKLDVIEREFAPTHLIVFGSRAKGEAHPGSDIDLVVVSERFRGMRFPNRMGEFLIKVRPMVAVDALCYTPEEFEAALEHQSPFARDAVASGLRVV